MSGGPSASRTRRSAALSAAGTRMRRSCSSSRSLWRRRPRSQPPDLRGRRPTPRCRAGDAARPIPGEAASNPAAADRSATADRRRPKGLGRHGRWIRRAFRRRGGHATQRSTSGPPTDRPRSSAMAISTESCSCSRTRRTIGRPFGTPEGWSRTPSRSRPAPRSRHWARDTTRPGRRWSSLTTRARAGRSRCAPCAGRSACAPCAGRSPVHHATVSRNEA